MESKSKYYLKQLQHLKVGIVARDTLLAELGAKIHKAKKIFGKYDPTLMDPKAYYKSHETFMNWFDRYAKNAIAKINELEKCVAAGDTKLYYKAKLVTGQDKPIPGIFIPIPPVIFSEVPQDFPGFNVKESEAPEKHGGQAPSVLVPGSSASSQNSAPNNTGGIADVSSSAFRRSSSCLLVHLDSTEAGWKPSEDAREVEVVPTEHEAHTLSTASSDNLGNSTGAGDRQPRSRAASRPEIYFTSSESFPELPETFQVSSGSSRVDSAWNLQSSSGCIPRPKTAMPSEPEDLDRDDFEVAIAKSTERIRTSITDFLQFVDVIGSESELNLGSRRPSHVRSLESLDSQQYFGCEEDTEQLGDMNDMHKSSSDTSVVFAYQGHGQPQPDRESLCPIEFCDWPVLPSTSSNLAYRTSSDSFFQDAVNELRKELSNPGLKKLSAKRVMSTSAINGTGNKTPAGSGTVHDASGQVKSSQVSKLPVLIRSSLGTKPLEGVVQHPSKLRVEAVRQQSEISGSWRLDGRIRRKPKLGTRRTPWQPKAPWRFGTKKERSKELLRRKYLSGMGNWKNRLHKITTPRDTVGADLPAERPQLGNWNNRLQKIVTPREVPEGEVPADRPQVGTWSNRMQRIVLQRQNSEVQLEQPQPPPCWGTWNQLHLKVPKTPEPIPPRPKPVAAKVGGTWKPRTPRVQPPPAPRGPLIEFKEPFPKPYGPKPEVTYAALRKRLVEAGQRPAEIEKTIGLEKIKMQPHFDVQISVPSHVVSPRNRAVASRNGNGGNPASTPRKSLSLIRKRSRSAPNLPGHGQHPTNQRPGSSRLEDFREMDHGGRLYVSQLNSGRREHRGGGNAPFTTEYQSSFNASKA